jgi:hypothetical protein
MPERDLQSKMLYSALMLMIRSHPTRGGRPDRPYLRSVFVTITAPRQGR